MVCVCTLCVCVYTYTMEYYSVLKKNEIMLFATSQMDLNVKLPSELARERQISDIAYIGNLKKKNDAK